MPYVSPAVWTPKGVESLEAAAETAVRSATNTLVVAGPGAGKTDSWLNERVSCSKLVDARLLSGS